jgi:SEC-C motif
VSRHPSLAAELVPLPDLTPRATMGRNDACWCRSSLKWKKCHRDRDKMSAFPLSDILKREKEIRNKPLCLHPLAPADCSDRIIAAHSVQKRIGLRAIEENGHVLSFLFAMTRKFDRTSAMAPEPLGVSRASTFRGFCEKHDAALFRPIETQKWCPTKENAFLFSFRAVCYEYYAKLAAEEVAKWQKMWIDREEDFGRQIASQQFN